MPACLAYSKCLRMSSTVVSFISTLPPLMIFRPGVVNSFAPASICSGGIGLLQVHVLDADVRHLERLDHLDRFGAVEMRSE